MFIFVGDLCPEGGDPACTLEPTSPAAAPDYAPAGEIDWPEGAGTATIDGYDGPARLVDETVTVLAEIDLAEALGEVEGLGDLSGLRLRARRVEVNPGGIVPLHAQPDRPAYFVVTEGNLTYYGPEGTLTLGPSETFEDFGPNPNWWRNEGAVPVTLFAVDVVAS
ncbi:MAG: cupin domain-containing protein [Paracoccaceae bacterium]